MNRLFDSMTVPGISHPIASSGVYPMINLEEDESSLYVTAELPGISVEDLSLSVHNDSLSLRGERKIPEVDEKINYHRRERKEGFFRRVISLPVKVDADNVSAEIKNGILHVILPKAEEAKPRQITIRAE